MAVFGVLQTCGQTIIQIPDYIVGIILGMCTLGYLGDKIGRKWGSVFTASLMLVGAVCPCLQGLCHLLHCCPGEISHGLLVLACTHRACSLPPDCVGQAPFCLTSAELTWQRTVQF